MELGVIIGVVGTLIGIIAGIVQVTQYIQDRHNKGQKVVESKDLNHISGVEIPLIKHNLPHPQKFIGREKEIKKILALLRPAPYSQEHMICIDGVGGIGKSALAIQIAYLLRQLETQDRFEAIIWASAKKNIITADGIKSRHQIVQTLDQIYTTIAITLRQPEIIGLNISQQAHEIANLMIQQRTLLIIDNFETIDDEDVVSFLRELPFPTKCIVTSRHRIDVAYPIRLHGMESVEAEALIQSECARREISITADNSKKLYNRTGGVPLAIVLCIAQIAKGLGVDVILDRLGRQTNDVARFCFEYSLEQLNHNEWKLLITLTLFSAGTSREILGEVAELNEIDRDEGLAELEKLSLINYSRGKFWMLPLSLEYVQDRMLGERQDIVARLKHNFAKAYMNIKIESMEAAKFNIQAVHLAIDLSDLYAWDKKIADYLSANRRAINRGVSIIRIFVLEKKFTYLQDNDKHLHPEIQRILDDQLQNGIDVRILWQETVDEQKLTEPTDLIIFDGREVHIHAGHGGFYLDVDFPTDTDEIKLWQQRFSQWLALSLQWFIMRKE